MYDPFSLKLGLHSISQKFGSILKEKKTYYLSSIVFCDGINPTLSWKVSYLFSVCFLWKTFYRRSVSYHHPHILEKCNNSILLEMSVYSLSFLNYCLPFAIIYVTFENLYSFEDCLIKNKCHIQTIGKDLTFYS